MSISIDKVFGVFDEALTLRAKRGEILASNMANADTPNYKARDFDFRAALEQAQGKGGGLQTTHAGHLKGEPAGPMTTNQRHLTGSGGELTGIDLQYRVPSQASLDGNTVDTETEKGRFAENTLQYQAAFGFLSSKIKNIKDILAEG